MATTAKPGRPFGTPINPTTTSTPIAAKTQEASNALRDITSGIIGGIVSKVVEYPFDTIKVRLQSMPDHLPLQYEGPLDCIRQTFAKEGLRGFYRGISAPLAGAAAENASLFWSYEVAKDFIRGSGVVAAQSDASADDLPLGAKVTAGMVSGAVTSIILTPIELVKCRMQAPPDIAKATMPPAEQSPLRMISTIYRTTGLLGFWRGHLGTFFRETGGTAAWFGGNEALLLYFRHQNAVQQGRTSIADIQPLLWQQLVSGALAGPTPSKARYRSTPPTVVHHNVSGPWEGIFGVHMGCEDCIEDAG
ncbi:mitochondrial ornithine carrier protein [Recurvomyces mirabilis]|uniref:Mitochondrial ornithine carrier protein n=1 Tax=Recurvomyces mirabilis TaxID=574656 RepID=A0AAE0TMJ7_9PEZI|nr:mitochondrial ornithine carrier protein [Recurvomyces mirabilis]KAK5149572.1 mitochondrial ornithine carrier protein [Recurvomyces mirabilis]